jgi:hypothetical protein
MVGPGKKGDLRVAFFCALSAASSRWTAAPACGGVKERTSARGIRDFLTRSLTLSETIKMRISLK